MSAWVSLRSTSKKRMTRRGEASCAGVEASAEDDDLPHAETGNRAANARVDPRGPNGDPELHRRVERVIVGGERGAFAAGEGFRPWVVAHRVRPRARARSIAGDEQRGLAWMSGAHGARELIEDPRRGTDLDTPGRSASGRSRV